MKKVFFKLMIIGQIIFAGNFYAQTNVYVDLANSPVNPLSKPGWNLVFQDSFSGGKSSYWNWNSIYNVNYQGYCWGNVHSGLPYYNRPENVSFTSTTMKLTTKKENYHPPLSEGNYYVTKPYTSENVNSDDCDGLITPITNHTFEYGYFEIRCKNPKGQKMAPAFWMFGNPNTNSKWNEIDVFEVGVGDAIVMSNHGQLPNSQYDVSSSTWIYANPGQTFGNTWVTYAVKWEPNKIVWYINNVAVKIVTSPTYIIPNVAMRVKANSGVCESLYYDYNLAEIFPNDMEIDYIRVYQRPSHPTQANPTSVPTPDPIFTINKANGFSASSPVIVPTSKIIMDASQSYMPNDIYAVYVQVSDAAGALYGTDYGRILTAQEVANINKFDVKAYASLLGLNMTTNHYYRIKVVGSPWTEVSQYVYVVASSTTISFKINGQATTTYPAPINIAYNYGKSRVILDGSGTTTNDNNYFISVQQCNSAGVGSGTIISKWLTSSDKDYLAYFDVENLCNQYSFPLNYGNYYRVRFAGGTPVLTEKVQVIYINSCTTTISFNINGANFPFPLADTIKNGERIILDGAASSFCDNNFFISVQECTSAGVGIGTEIYDVKPYYTYNPANHEYRYYIGEFNIRDYCLSRNFVLGCDKYYRIKLAGGTPWTEMSKVIYILPCLTVNSSYELNGVDASTYHYPAGLPTVTLYSPTSISCNNFYWLSVQKRLNGVLVGPEAGAWLNETQKYSLRVTGDLDLAAFAKDPNGDGVFTDGIILTDSTTYKVKLVAAAGVCNSNTWVENNKYVFFAIGSGRIGVDEQDSSQIQTDDMVIYPNPTNGQVQISIPMGVTTSEIIIFDATGNLVKSFMSTGKTELFDTSELAGGIYFVECISDTGIFTKKLQVIK